ncbi:MAG: hypothetical protein WBD41_11190 [Rhodococcus sp. (in: high G+C Gram-positive bacteria)]|nr:hypothetical protein [Rhodococcus sp. EPR-157]
MGVRAYDTFRKKGENFAFPDLLEMGRHPVRVEARFVEVRLEYRYMQAISDVAEVLVAEIRWLIPACCGESSEMPENFV